MGLNTMNDFYAFGWEMSVKEKKTFIILLVLDQMMKRKNFNANFSLE